MRKLNSKLAPAVLFLALFAVACGVNQWRMSGEALDAVGQQFLSTGKLYDTLFEQGSLTAEEYRPWAAFAERFKVIYEPAVKSWLAAQTVKDKNDAANILLAVKNELLAFYIAAQAKKGGS